MYGVRVLWEKRASACARSKKLEESLPSSSSSGRIFARATRSPPKPQPMSAIVTALVSWRTGVGDVSVVPGLGEAVSEAAYAG